MISVEHLSVMVVKDPVAWLRLNPAYGRPLFYQYVTHLWVPATKFKAKVCKLKYSSICQKEKASLLRSCANKWD